MHLRILEDYIADLLKQKIDGRSEFIETSEVISKLMDIIIEEERRIPDFVGDGDSRNIRRSGLFDPDPSDDEFDDDFWAEYLADDCCFDDDDSIEALGGNRLLGYQSNEVNSFSDPGFFLPIGGFLITMERTGNKGFGQMRRIKWVAATVIALVVGFVVGILTAP